ncbi:hypothetical protein COO91_07453 [Nostoc flagelliforme CCNUN1]|uniref:Uncharacterized protein n=1 Tax=Nostoc flagelliforme CCNUN1 TaxID=2038116 RepID=A0A2K8T309_9NOSO|nr:hypothetical protein COO91_07453 [Nostoc flagelliforme CCNUN1]
MNPEKNPQVMSRTGYVYTKNGSLFLPCDRTSIDYVQSI